MKVGTKDLKNRLSHYLRRVRTGEVLHVMDRHQVVAEIRAVAPQEDDEGAWLAELESDGAITRGPGHLDDFEPVRIRGRRLSRQILEDRR